MGRRLASHARSARRRSSSRHTSSMWALMSSTLSIGASPRELARVRILRPAVTRPKRDRFNRALPFLFFILAPLTAARGRGADEVVCTRRGLDGKEPQGSYPGSFTPAATPKRCESRPAPRARPARPCHRRAARPHTAAALISISDILAAPPLPVVVPTASRPQDAQKLVPRVHRLSTTTFAVSPRSYRRVCRDRGRWFRGICRPSRRGSA